jgi:hypothetical protein
VIHDPEVPKSQDADLNASNITAQLVQTNAVYAPLNIELVFDPSTDIEHIDSSTLPADTTAEFPERQALALKYPGKLVILYRKAGGGFSTIGMAFVAMAKWPDQDSYTGRELAHETGHYFGLPHTFVEMDTGLTEEQFTALPLQEKIAFLQKVQRHDGRVYNKVWEASRSGWWPGQTDWADLGGSTVGSPAAVTWGPGRLDLFARGSDGRIYNKVWEASRSGWWPGQTDWQDVGGGISTVDAPGGALGSPAAVTWGPGRLDLTVRFINGGILRKCWNAGTSSWSPGQTDWEFIGVP